MNKSQLLLLAALGAAGAQAQTIFPDRMSVHPYEPKSDGPFLVQVKDFWLDSCGGTITAEVTANRVDILARKTRGEVCGAALLPFRVLFNARDLAPPGTVFAPVVEVRYRYQDDRTDEIRALRAIGFDLHYLSPVNPLQPGSWVTPELQNSGLFIDQQGDVVSVALFDYDEDGKAMWHYGVGRVDNEAFAVPMQSYREIVCVTQPCPRAARAEGGTISMVLDDRNQLLVNYRGVLRSRRVSEERSYVYQRLDFQRHPDIAQIHDSAALPDLTGDWVVGLKLPAGKPNDFRAVKIRYAGSEQRGGVPSHRFAAAALSNPDTEQFSIQCSALPNAPTPFCTVENYPSGDFRCDMLMNYPAVGESRAGTIHTHCRFEFEVIHPEFEMFKLD